MEPTVESVRLAPSFHVVAKRVTLASHWVLGVAGLLVVNQLVLLGWVPERGYF